jgi:carbonic anhydrase
MSYNKAMSTLKSHTAKTLVFTCMDERLEPAIRQLIHSQPGGAFHVALAGGGATLTSDTDSPVALKQIVTAYKINQVTDVYLQSHTDCGAYGLAGITFSSADEEATRLYADLAVARQRVEAALAQAGATPGSVTIHTQVINPAGELVDDPASLRR